MDRLANMIRLTLDDNVAVALSDIAEGQTALDRGDLAVVVRDRIPQGHKIALKPIAAGEPIIRFGMPVGLAKSTIEEGSLVHIHNVRSQYLDNEVDHYE